MDYLPLRSSAQLGGPFDFCAFASLAPSSARLSGNRFEVYSSSSAFLIYVGRDFMTERGKSQGQNIELCRKHFYNICMNQNHKISLPAQWRKTLLPILIFLIIILGIWELFQYFRYINWDRLTGFGEFTSPTGEYFRAKTLWDWLDLLIVPAVIAIGVWFLNRNEKKTERETAIQREALERSIALNKQRQDSLEAYFDRMSELLLSNKLRLSNPKDEVRNIARTRTLAVLRNLDGERKGQVVLFLYEAKLINAEDPIVNLSGADFTETKLQNVALTEINLSKTNFSKANFSNAEIAKANIRNAQFTEVDFSNSKFNKVDFSYSNLRNARFENSNLDFSTFYGADLSNSMLLKASLEKTTFTEANLENIDARGANLFEANLIDAKLIQANFGYGYGRTHLAKANFGGATLTRANLDGANLFQANLSGANCPGATFNNAYLGETDLSSAHIYHDNLTTAETLHEAILPDGTKHDGRVDLSKITKGHVLQAINRINKERRSNPYMGGAALGFYVVYKSRKYGLRYLIPWAYESESNLPHDVFDEKEAKARLIKLGFEVGNIGSPPRG